MAHRKIKLNLLNSFLIFTVTFIIFTFFYAPQNPYITGLRKGPQISNALDKSLDKTKNPNSQTDFPKKVNNNWRNLSKSQIENLSELGRFLYLQEPQKPIEPSKTYTILVWKYYNYIYRRHIQRYSTNHVEFDPFEKCSVKNCRLSNNSADLNVADLVLFHMQRIKGLKDLPQDNPRRKDQIWVFLTDETPYHTFQTSNVNLTMFDGIFNWSMTYRMDSDVPVPYGRTVKLENDIDIDNERQYNVNVNLTGKRNDVLVAIAGSNCGGKNDRWIYVNELKKYIDIDIYGHCGTLKCPGHYDLDCKPLDAYKFYLAFENSNCEEYVTEKLWWNAISKNSIPIVMGATKKNYNQLLPPNSYIHVNDFANPRDLARFLKYLDKNPDEYLKYFKWKNKYEVLQEHGYFGSISVHFCRLCEALNYNKRDPSVYYRLTDFWNVKHDCYPKWTDPYGQ